MSCQQSPVTPGMKAVVVGVGSTGMAAAELLHALGADVRIVDRSAEKVSPAFREVIDRFGFETAFGDHSAEQFAGAELVVPSPGVPVLKLAPYLPETARVMAETELAWHCVQHIPVLSVTGTNGKTTTVRLCAKMLEDAGKKVFLGGNIGTPLSRFVLEGGEADVLVLELSSFQLQTCSALRPKVGVLTNITVDHLDYHKDMDEYTDAKMRMFARQTFEDKAIFGPGLEDLPYRYDVKAEIWFFDDSARFPEALLKGRHNRLNMEAAFLACSVFGVTVESATATLREFTADEHTLETVGSAKGVIFVNDTKATTVDAVRAALETFETPILLLAGGVYKGGDLTTLRELIGTKCKAVGLYGGSREKFEQAWGGCAPISYDSTMEEAARRLMGVAAEGDVMLLAPATSSFDQYANYKARGEDFRRIQALLAGE
ncbi:UDP-N-acetylmuramoyl-L-alanine--D-glutamate ligase [Desulfovibrio mangrovi]|uniref:UDP-N-acetylmuramoyl-L-alanine--D-glutamate ligase n=1 Tax=Desulfovibrio mangrovi TaxID=2976983 RepID=UPI003B8483F7